MSRAPAAALAATWFACCASLATVAGAQEPRPSPVVLMPPASPRNSTPAMAPNPGVVTKEITYSAAGVEVQGFLALPMPARGRRPGVLVLGEWWGHDQHARDQAVRLGLSGYAALAVDMDGKGKLATHPEDAQKLADEAVKDGPALRAGFQAALDLLKKDPHVDATKTAAVGSCVGGSVVLAAARAGADLDAVATMHGTLATARPAAAGAVKARILVQTGADDPMVPATQVAAFRREMDAAGATYEVVTIPGAKHSFTNPAADKLGVAGVGYSAEADRASWDRFLKMLREVFGS